MTPPNPEFNWGNLWADLLKGVGKGLLVHDDSRLSQAALAGLEVFDDARERRKRDELERASGVSQDTLLKLWPMMSAEERAAFLRLSPAEQQVYTEELAGANDGASASGYAYPSTGVVQPPAPGRQAPTSIHPMSPNAISGWGLQSILPFGPDGSLKFPTYRR